jgi:hypothetical protein
MAMKKEEGRNERVKSRERDETVRSGLKERVVEKDRKNSSEVTM